MSKLFWVHLVHIIIFSSLLFYIGVVGKNLPGFIFPLLIALAIGIFGYHVYKAWTVPQYAWVNYVHILLIAPLFFFIGLWGKTTPEALFEYSLMIGFAAIGYHGYYMWKDLSADTVAK